LASRKFGGLHAPESRRFARGLHPRAPARRLRTRRPVRRQNLHLLPQLAILKARQELACLDRVVLVHQNFRQPFLDARADGRLYACLQRAGAQHLGSDEAGLDLVDGHRRWSELHLINDCDGHEAGQEDLESGPASAILDQRGEVHFGSVFVLRSGFLMNNAGWGSLVALRVVSASALRGLMQAFDIVDVFHISRDERPSGFHVMLSVRPLFESVGKAFANSGSDVLGDKFGGMIDGAAFKCLVGFLDGGAEFGASRLEAGEGGAFACAMDPHEGLEKELIGELLGCLSLGAYSEGAREGDFNLGLGLRLHPFEHRCNVFLRQGGLGGENNRAVHRVAMAEGPLWKEQASAQQDAGHRDAQTIHVCFHNYRVAVCFIAGADLPDKGWRDRFEGMRWVVSMSLNISQAWLA